jgi:hypothetical protein
MFGGTKKMYKLEFPREVGAPRKLVKDMNEYLAYIKLYNGKKKAIYTSVYMFEHISSDNKPEYDSAKVDKIYFDFDDKSCPAYDNVKRLHDDLVKDDIKHMIVMSGRGYHLYIFVAKNHLQHKKEAIRGCQEYYMNKLSLKVDPQVVGNVAQLARIPNTFHPIAGRFCIPLNKTQFDLGDNDIKQMAQQQNFIKDFYIGTKLLDISKWDIRTKSEFVVNDSMITPSNQSVAGIVLKELPLCISKCLMNRNMGWKERYTTILYFKEMGYTKEEVFELFKIYLDPRKLYHCVKEERQLQYLFERDDLVFPCCDKLKLEGFCPQDCKFLNKGVYV